MLTPEQREREEWNCAAALARRRERERREMEITVAAALGDRPRLIETGVPSDVTCRGVIETALGMMGKLWTVTQENGGTGFIRISALGTKEGANKGGTEADREHSSEENDMPCVSFCARNASWLQ